MPSTRTPSLEDSKDEKSVLLGFLNQQREEAIACAQGLSAEELLSTPTASSLSVGGTIKHLALVEQWWFDHMLLGRPSPAESPEFEQDPDWDFHSAHLHTPRELIDLYRSHIAHSNAIIEATHLETQTATKRPNGQQPNLRWVLLHMIEEVARHCGQMDIIREQLDGHANAF